MKIQCGMTKANIIEQTTIKNIKVYYGTGVNPVNSPAQFFVAWGRDILKNETIGTFNQDTEEKGHLWFVDEEEAEEKYREIIALLSQEKITNTD